MAAEPTRLETLVRNLKELRRSLDSGSVAGPAATFGLAPPVATVRLWAEQAEPTGQARRPDRDARGRQDGARQPLCACPAAPMRSRSPTASY